MNTPPKIMSSATKIVLFLTCCIVISICSFNDKVLFPKKIRFLVTNGIPASNAKFFVRILFIPPRQSSQSVPLCGGAIIGVHWVVTSAQCVTHSNGTQMTRKITHCNSGTAPRPKTGIGQTNLGLVNTHISVCLISPSVTFRSIRSA